MLDPFCDDDRRLALWIDTRATVATVDLEEDVERSLETLESLDRLGRVDEDAQRRALGETPNLLQSIENDRKGPGEVVEARVDERAGLLEGRDRDSRRASLELHPADVDRLVCLDVWTQPYAETVRFRRHAVQVAFEFVQIDDESRSR